MTGDSSFDRLPIIINRHTRYKSQIIVLTLSIYLFVFSSRISPLVCERMIYDVWNSHHVLLVSIKDQGSSKYLIVKLRSKYFIKDKIACGNVYMYIADVYNYYFWWKMLYLQKSLTILSSWFYRVETIYRLPWWIFRILSDETLTVTYIR